MNQELPFIVVNLGAEMIYILEQRLEAQSVPQHKADRVLKDLLTALFNKSFIEDLLMPQPLLSLPCIRALFVRVAHSSIMKLNSDSMDRLLDLMVCLTVLYQS
ncbi:hypothetical protein GEMRC1_007164 [Eukaryota sp. GEM-RC1]